MSSSDEEYDEVDQDFTFLNLKSTSQFGCKRLLMTYPDCQLDESSYKKWFKKNIGKFEDMKVFNEKIKLVREIKCIPDDGSTKEVEVSIPHSHVIADFGKALNIRAKKLRIKTHLIKNFYKDGAVVVKTLEIQRIKPIVRSFKSSKQYKEVLDNIVKAHRHTVDVEKESIIESKKEEKKLSFSWAKKKKIITYKDLYVWQKELINFLLSTAPDDRKVTWYYDTNGNKGKTTVANFLKRNLPDDVFLFNGLSGSINDCVYILKKAIDDGWTQRCLIINIPRSEGQSKVVYKLIEMVKDRKLISGKYKSEIIELEVDCHVVVMSNFLPEKSELSADRWSIKTMSGDREPYIIS